MAGTNVVVVDRGNGTTCSINLLGATVVSWRVKSIEQIFVSSNTRFDQQTAISGGIQIIFPHYGYWKFGPKHGFARLVRWNIEKAPQKIASDDIEVEFSLTDTEYTKSIWNFSFKIIYRLILREKELRFYVTIKNLSNKLKLHYDFLLSNYIKVSDVRNYQLLGLYRSIFFDKFVSLKERYMEDNLYLTVEQETERIYQSKNYEIILIDSNKNTLLEIQKENFPSILLWNPWKEKIKENKYFDEDDYLKMICIGMGYADIRNDLSPCSETKSIQILKSKI